jgi:TonB-dependent starch-binding outer membrane protein SusC
MTEVKLIACYMKRLTCLLVFFCTLFGFAAKAQTVQVKGNVSDSSGAPLPGVSIVVKDTKKGTQTDAQGNFSLTVTAPSGKVTLTFSSTNFKTQTIATDGKSPVNIRLERDVAQIEDVVVIGYQTVRRKDLLASVSSVGAKELKDVPINSAAEALNGRLAGVTATTSEGSPDAEVRVRVRGGMSITGDNSPLYIVDGVQVENALNTISPQDIQTIDVLKDAAATAIYGARGANGVIVITTKSGKTGKLRMSYNGFVGTKWLAKELDVLSPYDFIVYQSERSRGNSTDSTTFTKNFGTTWDTLKNYMNVPATDWQKEVLGKNGITTTHNVSGSGGTNKMTYSFGYTFNDDKAIVLNSKYVRHLLNVKADYKITKSLKIGGGARYTNQNVYGAGVSDDKGSAYNRLRNAVKYRPFLSSGQDIDDSDPFADPNAGNGLSLVNPIQLANAEYRRKTTDAYNITLNASYTILKNLVFKSTFGFDKNSVADRQFSDSVTPYSRLNGGNKPIVRLDTTDKKTITNSNVLTYSLKNYKRQHNFDVLLGEETYDLRTEGHSSLFRDFPNGTSHDAAFTNTSMGNSFTGYPKLGKTRYTNLSFFSRVSYDFKNKYYFSFNVRADGASKFAGGKRWGYFPAASFAWRVKSEKFMEDVNFLTDLKFRAGFGTVGNNRIDDYQYLTNFSNNGSYYYGIGGTPVIGYYPAALANENLKWESTVNRNIGVDLTLFKRIDISVDVYNNTSKDLLLFVPIASTYGYTEQFQNVGKTSNKGVEVQVNANILRRKNNLSWTANFNISTNKNIIKALGQGQTEKLYGPSWGVSGQPQDYLLRIGEAVGTIYGWVTDGFYTVNDFNYNSTTGVYTLKSGVANNSSLIGVVQPGSVKFKDLNGDGIVDLDHDRTIIGNPTPEFTGGLNQQFTYKQWDASIFFNFSVGGDVYNANKIEFTNGYTNNSNLLSVMEGRWRVVTETGQTAQWVSGSTVYGIPPDQLAALNANATIWQPLKGSGAFYPHSWAIEDGSFVRLNNVTVGYSLPVKSLIKLHISKLRLYATGNNLALFTNYSGYDPEVSVRKSPLTPGLDYSAYPKSRSFIFGVNVIF